MFGPIKDNIRWIDWLIGKSFTPFPQYFSHVTAKHTMKRPKQHMANNSADWRWSSLQAIDSSNKSDQCSVEIYTSSVLHVQKVSEVYWCILQINFRKFTSLRKLSSPFRRSEANNIMLQVISESKNNSTEQKI